MSQKITITDNKYLCQQYKNGVLFEIEFSIGRIKTKTTELRYNPIPRSEDTIPPFEFEKRLNEFIFNYKWV